MLLTTIVLVLVFAVGGGCFACWRQAAGGCRELIGALLVMVSLLCSAGLVAFTSERQRAR